VVICGIFIREFNTMLPRPRTTDRHTLAQTYVKMLAISAAILVLSTTASGLTLTSNCTPFPVTFTGGSGGPTAISCPPFTIGGGAILNSVTLNYSADYQFGGAGPNTVMTTFIPAGPPGVTWAAASTTTTQTGGTSSGSIVTASAVATSGVSAANFATAFNVNVSAALTQGTVATSSGAVSVTYDYTSAPPPPPTTTCDASVPIFATGAPLDAFQVNYAANLNVGDSVINITNAGSSITDGVGGDGNLCVHVYTFSPDEQEISCCSCLVTPNALVSLSAQNDLISNVLTPSTPTSIVVKLVATGGGGNLAPGMRAWGTTLHAAPSAGFATTETPFSNSALSVAEFNRITALCGFIQANGSGFGICRGCRLGGLGAIGR
jgi:hypothetical protein